MRRDELNRTLDDIPGIAARASYTFDELRPDFHVGGTPVIDAAELPHYADYPARYTWSDLVPWTHFALLAFAAGYGAYDGAKSHWGTRFLLRRSKWWSNLAFDVLFAVAVAGMFFDTVTSVNRTYTEYMTLDGIEGDATLRQWAAALERLGVPYAPAIALTDVLEGAVLCVTWYYGRRERNAVSLAFLAYYTWFHWDSWAYSSSGLLKDIAGLPLFFRQLTGQLPPHDFQGGGPQTVIGTA